MRERTRSEELTTTAVVLLYAAYAAWVLVPEHTRRLWTLRALRRLETATGELARRAGRAAMRAELSGDHPGYEVPELLSRVRDGFARLYGRVRGG